MKIAVIGDGGWGTANALLLAGYGHDVTVWGAFPDYIEECRRTRRNEKFLKGVTLPDALKLTADREEAVKGAEVVVLAPPSKYFTSVVSSFKGLITPEMLVVSITKGLCEKTNRRMTDLGAEILGTGPLVHTRVILTNSDEKFPSFTAVFSLGIFLLPSSRRA